MFSDVEAEAAPVRRIIAFAALFLGLFTFAQLNFAGGQALIAPPIATLIVLLSAVGGLLVWVRGRWSRTLLWLGAALAILSTGAAALRAVPASPVVGLAVIIAMAMGALASVYRCLADLRAPALDRWRRHAMWIVLAALAALTLLTPASGPAARLSLTAAAVLVIITWILRPEET